MSRGLRLWHGDRPICKCKHRFEQHWSGDRMNHYAQCRMCCCKCDSFQSMDNLEWLEYLSTNVK